MSGLAVRTAGLVHIYHAEGHDVAALSGIDLHVQAGETVGLLGPSGAGKSTLLGLLAGLFPPSAGRIHLGGHDLTALTPRELDRLRATEVSLMLQGAHRNLLPYCSPLQNVELAQSAARRAGKDLPEPLDVLGQVGLSATADTPLNSLTPGHLQLAAIAAAIAKRPGLLLADEPTSQLEPDARQRVLDTLRDINADLGTTVVLVTHDPQVATALPHTVAVCDGRIGGEGRGTEEYAVVTADGSLPLPPHVREDLVPGTLVRFHRDGERYVLETGVEE